MESSRNNHTTWRQLIPLVAMIAVPVALQNLLTTTGSMVDTVMLASLGEKTVGAVGLCDQFSIGALSAEACCFLPNIMARAITAESGRLTASPSPL